MVDGFIYVNLKIIFEGFVMSESRKIPMACFSNAFSFGESKETLLETSEYIAPDEYAKEMKGFLFCSQCTVPLDRVPIEKNITSSGKEAHFKHHRGYAEIPCIFRSPPNKKVLYNSEETVRQAINNGELNIISSWKNSPPEEKDVQISGINNVNALVDESFSGENVDLPLGRHNGEKFNVPSKVTTVQSICTELPDKLNKYFYFPKSSNPVMLLDALVDIRNYIDDWRGSSYLYYGKIVSFCSLDYRNLIKLGGNGKIVEIYTDKKFDVGRRISNLSIGRWMLVYGSLTKHTPPRIMTPVWGEYCLLPPKYESIIEAL